jgi:hypothetical protein
LPIDGKAIACPGAIPRRNSIFLPDLRCLLSLSLGGFFQCDFVLAFVFRRG